MHAEPLEHHDRALRDPLGHAFGAVRRCCGRPDPMGSDGGRIAVGCGPAGRVSDEIVHGVDLFPTLAGIAGAAVPNDRPIDGVDQSNFFLGKTEKSSREGILIWCADRLQAVKWRNYKVHFYQQETMVSPPVKLGVPKLFNLYTNPLEDDAKPTVDSWVVGPVLRMVADFEESTKEHPLIPMGTPDPYTPRKEGKP